MRISSLDLEKKVSAEGPHFVMLAKNNEIILELVLERDSSGGPLAPDLVLPTGRLGAPRRLGAR